MRDIFGELEEMVREDIEKMEYDIDCWLPEAIDKFWKDRLEEQP